MVSKKSRWQQMVSLLLILLATLMLVSNALDYSIRASAFTPQTSAPAKDNKYYYSTLNPFYPDFQMPNCTCYAYGRAYEILGTDPKLPTGNAGTWYETDTKHKKGQTPQLGAIACWKGKTDEYNGHVAVVEAINGNKISFSESNWKGKIFNYQKNKDPATFYSGSPCYYTFQGYIYIGEAPDPVKPGTMSGTYLMKNVGTNSYAYVNGSDADKTDIALGTDKSKDAYKMKFVDAGSGTQPSCFIQPVVSSTRVVNPFADTPTNGTNVNLYKKSSDGTQQWVLESVSGGYIIRNFTNQSLVLTASGSTVKVNTYSSGNKNQIWSLESPSVSVNAVFHRNLDASDTTTVTETFTTGVSNQKFGYKTDGSGRYSTMNEASVGFGQWSKPGYRMLGWSKDANATKATWDTYSAVVDSWISGNSPKIDLYAVWEQAIPDWKVYSFKGSGTQKDPYQIGTAQELIEMQKAVNELYYNPSYGSAYYIQTADIDLSGINWIPIGKRMKDGTDFALGYFTGHYDGNYHQITGMKIEDDQKFVGLFGNLNDNASVKNLHVEGTIKATASGSNGGIVGEISGNSVVDNCSFTGSIETKGNGAGGVVGYIWQGGTITNCYSNCTITGASSADIIGGIVGMIKVGTKSGSKDASISNCYHVGAVTGSGDRVGSAFGLIEIGTDYPSDVTVSNVFVRSTDAGNTYNGAKFTGEVTAIGGNMLKQIADDLGSAFTNCTEYQNYGYPVLVWELIRTEGDVNADGQSDVADVVVLQKWLHSVPGTKLADSEAADLDADGCLDVFDLSLLKYMLLNK